MHIKPSIPQTYPVACHTDNVGKGTTFIAISGTNEDGTQYIPLALSKGASTIVVEENVALSPDISDAIQKAQATLMRVHNTRKALADLSAQALNYPAKKLKIIGITGTKGKSTTTFLLEHLLQSTGHKTALLSTIKNRILDTELPTQLTTQQPDYLHVFFDTCVKHDVEYVIMEVAAQALSLHRVAGIEFYAGIFTNFSQEHLEFYDSLEEYFQAKKLFLSHLTSDSFFIHNQDDERTAGLTTSGSNRSFGLSTYASIQGIIKHNTQKGLSGSIVIDNQTYFFEAPTLIGEFNMYNILAAIGTCSALTLDISKILETLKTFKGVPGRMLCIPLSNGALGCIDYAHNPASFEAILSTLRSLTPHLITVFGAGGDRDRVKRPLMGDIASKFSDAVIVTTDNPRSEDPDFICQEILQGISPEQSSKVLYILDREEAIRKAYELSRPESIIALLGKGPDEYQLVKGVKIPFSEQAILKSL